jgi:transcriptional regulator with GAF, ATPase, and Fis domain
MADKRPSGDMTEAVNSLADLRLSEETLDSVTGHIGRLGVQALDGWDAAGTCMVEGRQVATYGITDELIRKVDQGQYDSGQGPCVDAMRNGEVNYFNDESFPPRWRRFADTAADAGIYSVLSFPLKLDEEVIGAMNFYSKERDAMRSGQQEEGWVFASQAAVTLSNAKKLISKSMQVQQLETGLETRTMIGQATGLLMAQEGLTSDHAFQKLVSVSQNANLKLRDIAQRYVQSWEEKMKDRNNKLTG